MIPETKKRSVARSILFFGLMWALFFLLCILVRLPYFLSKNYWFDGDEAIIGIMAQDLLRTGHVPFFFYGQHYGFATFEVLSASAFIAVFGKTVYSLKLAGLLLHSLAIAICWKWMRLREVSFRVLVPLFILLICFPPFSLWASQMRTVSFLLFITIVFILESYRLTRWNLLLVFGLGVLLAYSQAMTFLFCAVFIADALFRQKKGILRTAVFFGAILAVIFLIQWLVGGERSAHDVSVSFGSAQFEQLSQQLRGFGAGFTGFHYFTMKVDEPLWWLLLSRLMIALLLLWTFLLAIRVTRAGRRTLLFFTLATLLFLVFLSCFTQFSPRYWINLFTGVLILLLVLTGRNPKFVKQRFQIPALLALLAFVGIFAGSKQRMHFADAPESEAASFNDLHAAVIRSGKKALFTTDVYLQWQWNYLYGDQVPCSSFYRFERTNRFTDRVNSQYSKQPASVGIIGIWGIFLEMDYIPGFNDERQQFGGKYYFVSDVKEAYIDHGREVMDD